jgi:hypothetical protein
MTEPPASPETEPGIVRIRLSEAASAALTASGQGVFTIVHRVMRGAEEPGSAGRWEITLAPIEWRAAVDASRVLLGSHRAVKVKVGGCA